MKKLMLLLMLLALTGCAEILARGERNATAGIKGQTVDVAIARFGIPTEEKTIAGRKVVIWRDVEAQQLYCQMTVMYGEDGRALNAELAGQNGPCMNWLARRGF